MAKLFSCAEACKELRKHHESAAIMPELAEQFVASVGRPAVDAMIASEQGFAYEIIAGAGECPGYQRYPGYVRGSLKFLAAIGMPIAYSSCDGICSNPVLGDEERRDAQQADRQAFDDLRDAEGA